MDLVLRDHFPSPPPQSVIDGFLEHVRATGQPETFPQISTTKPPVEGDVEVLAERITINTKLRPDRDWAPCPICSPAKPKYFSDGTLIWCGHTRAIYAIGPRCSTSIWTDDRLQVAKNQFRRSQKEREEAAGLFHHVRRAQAMSTWAAVHLDAIRAAESAHRDFARSMRTLRLALSRSIKTSGGSLRLPNGSSVGWVMGSSFLTGSWPLEREVTEALKKMDALATEAGADPQAWAEGMAPTLRRAKLKTAHDIRHALVRTSQRVAAAAQFLSPPNIEALVTWSKMENAPIAFQVSHTGNKVDLRQGADRWQGPLGLKTTAPVP